MIHTLFWIGDHNLQHHFSISHTIFFQVGESFSVYFLKGWQQQRSGTVVTFSSAVEYLLLLIKSYRIWLSPKFHPHFLSISHQLMNTKILNLLFPHPHTSCHQDTPFIHRCRFVKVKVVNNIPLH